MTIISQITTYDESSYQTLHDFMEKSYVELTFLGKRSVRSIGYEGSICLDEIAWKIDLLYRSQRKISENERDLGSKISKKILIFESIREDLVKHANLITRLFVFLRDWVFYTLINPSYSDPFTCLPDFL